MNEPSPIEFWDFCRELHEMANDHWTKVRTIETRYDFIEENWNEKKAESDFSQSATALLDQFDSLDRFLGFPEFGELASMYFIVARMATLLRQTIIHRDLTSGLFGRHADNWGNLNFELQQSINYCAHNHPEIYQVVYQRAISGIKAKKPKPRNPPQTGPLPRLAGKKKLALEIIKKEGPIIGRLIAEKIDIELSTFNTHYVPILKLHGVQNDENSEGYYYLDKSRSRDVLRD